MGKNRCCGSDSSSSSSHDHDCQSVCDIVKQAVDFEVSTFNFLQQVTNPITLTGSSGDSPVDVPAIAIVLLDAPGVGYAPDAPYNPVNGGVGPDPSPTMPNIITSIAQLTSCHTYYVGIAGYFLGGNIDSTYYLGWASLSSFNQLGASIADLAYTYKTPLIQTLTIVGNPFEPASIDQYLGLFYYIIDKINNLCLPCCIKQKMNDAVINFAITTIAPTDGAEASHARQIFSTISSTFCNKSLPSCGPIYVANIMTVDANCQLDATQAQNTIIYFLQIIKYYIKANFSTKCCCGNHEADGNISYRDACECVFGNICVVDFNIPPANNNEG